MILNKQKWIEVRYGNYVDHIERNETNPRERKNARYVSVEHLETENLKVNSWTDEEMPTFFRTFRKGQILFGKRRAYQRKVAIADFDGICSPHIWALEARSGLMQHFLPYVMLTERFYEYVNANSAGTMSPYIKWLQLSKYTFALPPLDEQQRIAELFQSIEQGIVHAEMQEGKSLTCHAKAWHILYQSHQQTLWPRGRVVSRTVSGQTHSTLQSFTQSMCLHPCQPCQRWFGCFARRLGVFQLPRMDESARRNAGQPRVYRG